MALTLREVKGSALTINEMDNNFRYFTGSHAITGSLIVSTAVTASAFAGDGSGLTGVTGEWDGSHNGNASITGSLTVTAGITANLTGSVLGTAATASFFDVVNYVAGLGEYADDAAAAAGSVPVGGLYKNGNFIQIRIV
jgi:hypothetical protein